MPRVEHVPGLRAGFHLEIDDRRSGLVHVGEQWAPPQFMIYEHVHEVWEFYLQMHGRTHWMADGAVRALHPGHLLGVGPRVPHRMAGHPASSHHFYYAAIDLTVITRRVPELATGWNARVRVIHKPDGAATAAPFAQLIREVTQSLAYSPTGLSLAVDRLALEVSRANMTQTGQPPSIIHPVIVQLRELLDNEYSKPWTLRELGDRAGLAPTYLAALFRDQIGVSPHTYLTERRIDRARVLLDTTDLAVSAISAETGFTSSQHFARVFRRVTDRSPREYRRRNDR